jgi:hypothetical protein
MSAVQPREDELLYCSDYEFEHFVQLPRSAELLRTLRMTPAAMLTCREVFLRILSEVRGLRFNPGKCRFTSPRLTPVKDGDKFVRGAEVSPVLMQALLNELVAETAGKWITFEPVPVTWTHPIPAGLAHALRIHDRVVGVVILPNGDYASILVHRPTGEFMLNSMRTGTHTTCESQAQSTGEYNFDAATNAASVKLGTIVGSL